MSVLSIPVTQGGGGGGGSVSEQASPMAPGKAQAANELYGCENSMSLEGAIRKRIAPIAENARTRIWMSQDLRVYSNSEYAYAIFPISIDLLWGKGCREVSESDSLDMIFAILTHCLNTTATNNYSVRTKGQWFCQDTILIGFSHYHL